MDASGPDTRLEQPDQTPEQTEGTLEQSVSEQAAELPKQGETVSDAHFEQVVRDALEGVGGMLLFKMRLDGETGADHVAAAAIGEGAERRLLLLTLPAGATQLKVETAAKSSNPLAAIAASYAGLADALATAA